jgi:uncharacterized protein with HEPN domain
MVDKNTQIIKKIIIYSEKVLSYCHGVTKNEFISDSKLAEACVFNLAQIGELVRLFNQNFLDSHKNIEWHKIRGLRNKIIHEYERVNFLLVWDIISNHLPIFVVQLKEIIK